MVDPSRTGGLTPNPPERRRRPIWVRLVVTAAACAAFLIVSLLVVQMLRSPDYASTTPTPSPTYSASASTYPSSEPTRTSDPSETASRTPSPTKDSEDELDEFLRKCEESLDADRQGQIDHPANMWMKVRENQSYNAAVDVRIDQVPPEINIDGPKPGSERVRVRCILSARLVAVGKGIEVVPSSDTDGDGWRALTFTPDGVVEWSWTVTPTVPADQELQLELQPAVKMGEGSQSAVRASTVYYKTEVFVEATRIERLSYWFNTQWPLLTSVVGAIGVAILALLAFSTKFRDAARAIFKRKPAATAESAEASDAAPEPEPAEQQKAKQKSTGKDKGRGK